MAEFTKADANNINYLLPMQIMTMIVLDRQNHLLKIPSEMHCIAKKKKKNDPTFFVALLFYSLHS